MPAGLPVYSILLTPPSSGPLAFSPGIARAPHSATFPPRECFTARAPGQAPGPLCAFFLPPCLLGGPLSLPAWPCCGSQCTVQTPQSEPSTFDLVHHLPALGDRFSLLAADFPICKMGLRGLDEAMVVSSCFTQPGQTKHSTPKCCSIGPSHPGQMPVSSLGNTGPHFPHPVLLCCAGCGLLGKPLHLLGLGALFAK